MDTFARNEGEDGGKAHFKFVFTLDGGESSSPFEDRSLWPLLLCTARSRHACVSVRLQVFSSWSVFGAGVCGPKYVNVRVNG